MRTRCAYRPCRMSISTSSHSRCVSWRRSAWSMICLPVTQISAICAACEPTASTTENASPRRYGLRKERSRAKVLRYGTALTAIECTPGVLRSSGSWIRRLELRELGADERGCLLETVAVGRDVEPAARAGRMRQRDDRNSRALEALADARRERREAEETPQREPADGDDQPRPEQLELPVAPEGAELLLPRSRRPVASAGRRPAGIAARHRGAVEGRVELVLLELEPAAKRPAGAAAPRQPLVSLDHTGRLAEEVGALPGAGRVDGEGLEWIAGCRARAAAGEVALERRERAVGRLPEGHDLGA